MPKKKAKYAPISGSFDQKPQNGSGLVTVNFDLGWNIPDIEAYFGLFATAKGGISECEFTKNFDDIKKKTNILVE